MVTEQSANQYITAPWGAQYRIQTNGSRWGQGQEKGSRVSVKLQTLVYDILPSTTEVFSYAIGPRKLSANEQFFLLVLKQ